MPKVKIMDNKNNFNLTPEFQQTLQVLQNDIYKCVFVTGKAGTGKSTLLKYYVENIAPKGKTVVLAPTGIAAVNVGGQTIHSFFRFPLRILLEDDKCIERLPKKIENLPTYEQPYEQLKAKLIRSIEVIVIDEISMVRADIMDGIDTYLRINTESYQPFGGKKMVFFGDLFQLAPVVDGKNTEQQQLIEDFKKRYPSPYFFEAKVFQKQPIHLIELQTIHRQTDKDFIDILNHIRVGDIDLTPDKRFTYHPEINGKKIESIPMIEIRKLDLSDVGNTFSSAIMNMKTCTDPRINLLNKRYKYGFKITFNDGSINLLTRNADVDQFNQTGLAQLSGKLYTYTGMINGEFNKANLPAPMELQLKVGAQVMFLRNKSISTEIITNKDDEEEENEELGITTGRGWQNGTLGTVMGLSDEAIVVKIEENGTERNVVVVKEVWENIRYEYDEKKKEIIKTVLGTYTQYPLKLAYAITVHKSQGMTFQKVNIDVSEAFAEGQVYVALSRARSLSGITLLNPVDPYKIKVNPRVIEFYRKYNKT